MKIAFISYEYPPDTAIGGIATYVEQIANVMCQGGHQVEVFAASLYRSCSKVESGIVVHRIHTSKKDIFSEQVAITFAQRHKEIKFDVLEGAEISAFAQNAVALVSDIPLVIKLHTPSFLVNEINVVTPTMTDQLRWYLGSLRRIQKIQPYPSLYYEPESDPERFHTLEADEVTTPSQDLGVKVVESWGLSPEKVVCIPNPYVPSLAILEIPISTHTNVVTFIGRLEIRKGILELAQAIPMILRNRPDAIFRFVGASHPSPQSGLDMQQYLERKWLRHYNQSVEFTGAIALQDIPSVLAKTDICVFPSRWENFPNVCLEAMSAGRGVVGSSAGGMSEMLEEGRVGRLVPPNNPRKIAEAVLELLNNPELRMQLGIAARQRILSEYNHERIGALQEASYLRAIERRRALGSRSIHD